MARGEGDWQVSDASFNTTNPRVTLGNSGMGRNQLLVNESVTYTPTNVGSYNYTPPVWPSVNSAGQGAVEPKVGLTSEVEVFRGTTTENSWTLTASNLYTQ